MARRRGPEQAIPTAVARKGEGGFGYRVGLPVAVVVNPVESSIGVVYRGVEGVRDTFEEAAEAANESMAMLETAVGGGDAPRTGARESNSSRRYSTVGSKRWNTPWEPTADAPWLVNGKQGKGN